MRSQRDVGDRLSYAAFDEHPVESAAGADHEENRGGRREAVVGELEDLIPGEMLPVPKRPEGKQQRQEQGHDRTTDEIERRAECAAAVERDVRGARA